MTAAGIYITSLYRGDWSVVTMLKAWKLRQKSFRHRRHGAASRCRSTEAGVLLNGRRFSLRAYCEHAL